MLSSLPLRRVAFALLGALPVALLYYLFNRPRPGVVSDVIGPLHPLLVWLVLALGALLASQVRGWLARATAVLCAVVMALARLVGAHFTPGVHPPFERIGWSWLPELLVDLAVMSSLATLALTLLAEPRRALRCRARVMRRQLLGGLGAALVMVLAWTPYLLMYFPGILVRDSWTSLRFSTGEYPLGNHHPVLFNLWVRQCQHFSRWAGGGVTLGVAIFSVIQAVVLAVGLAVVVVWLGRRLGRWPAALGLLLFALSPQIAMWSITMQKDTLFVLWTTLLTVLLVEAAHRGLAWLVRPWPLVGVVYLLLAIAFSRNNGPYVSLVLVVLLVLTVLPRLVTPLHDGWRWWRLPLAGILALTTIFMVQGPGYRAAGVVPGQYAETVGLPLQQVSWAMVFGEVTPEQEGMMANLLPVHELRSSFGPTIVDSVKFHPNFNPEWLNHHPDEFLHLWQSVLPANKLSYACAWYGLSGGYLDPGRLLVRADAGNSKGSGPVHIEGEDLLGPLLGAEDARGVTNRTINRVMAYPLVNLAFSMPLVFWLSALAALSALLSRRLSWVLPFAPYLLVVGTLLVAAPVTDFRYVAAGHVGLPVLLAAAWISRPVRPVAPGTTSDLEPAGSGEDDA
ncbi:DUF6020 family protein [Luteococcus sp. H138]|uniref:DUF6020 family protein n=1 Tax=unclassified Luteococcus TaxID=2639923 RepID=UPI00313DF8BC